MQAVDTYAIGLGTLFGAFALLQLIRALRQRAKHSLFTRIRKWFFYATLVRRRSGSTDCTVLSTAILLTYVGVNVFSSVISVSSKSDLTKRFGGLCLINTIPLYLGGLTSYIVDHLFRISLHHYHLMHRWVGRICLLFGLAHGILHQFNKASQLEPIQIALLASLGVLGVPSFLYIRRRAYELFLSTHTVTSVALLVFLWLHVPRNPNSMVSLGIASGLWGLQKALFLCLFIRRNGLGGATHTATIIVKEARGLEIRIELQESMFILPGQYVYITIPQVRPFRLGYFESHPFYVSWMSDTSNGRQSNGSSGFDEEARKVPLSKSKLPFMFLHLEAANGFTKRILQCQRNNLPVLIDGPYGRPPPLHQFDIVLFLASGIGIAAQLLQIQHLLKSHNARTARARRITVVWFLQTNDQYFWVADRLAEILSLDERKIVNIHKYSSDSPGHVVGNFDPKQITLDIGFLINSEWTAEAGNMAIYLCGPPAFEEAVRKVLLASSHDISLFTSSFHPDETYMSQASIERFRA